MSKSDGGPAFPNRQTSSYIMLCKCGKRVEFNDVTHHGMTLRDYFAAAALQGILAGVVDNQPAHMPHYSNGAEIDRSDFATTAYQYADAMLKEREK